MTELGAPTLRRSRELHARSRAVLAGGVASTLRLAVKPTPLFVSHGRGSRLVDVDGNEYVDYTMAYGPLILGHAHPAVVEAVSAAVRRGSTYGAQHETEIDLAAAICEVVPNAELVALSGSGTEAVMLALRLSRAATGRVKVVRFEGHYHGWSDSIFIGEGGSAPVPGTGGQSAAALSDLVVMPWNDAAALRDAFADLGGEIAAVICEPIVCNSGCLFPRPGYLEELRRLTREHGALLVLDEVITGFRVALGGAQERLGIDADLAVFGKALSGGLPLSAVAGRADVLERIASGEVSHLGTLNGNTVATAAALATVTELRRAERAALANASALAERLVAGLRERAEAARVPLVVNAAGPVFFTAFTEAEELWDHNDFQRRDVEAAARFAQLLLARGIYVRPNGLWYVSTVHTETDVERTLDAAADALVELDEGRR